MKYCGKCGKQIEENAKFCPICGAIIEPTNHVQEQPSQTQKSNNTFQNLTNTPDTTSDYSATDINTNKVMAILSYFGPLVLIPIFAAKDSGFARYHANQGLILLLASVLYSIAYGILSSIIYAISWRLYFITNILSLAYLLITVLCVIGIINAASGKAKELPIIGKFKILK